MVRLLLTFALFLTLAISATFAITIPGDGSDGALNVPNTNASYVIDLSKAVTGAWNTPGTGNGVYDPTKWAVVFKYTSVNIPAGVTVSFINHTPNAPVIWLVQGNVTIAGGAVLDLDGTDGGYFGDGGYFTPGGPGGFPGGSLHGTLPFLGAVPDLQGFGVTSHTGPGNYDYGNPQLLPLIGGSGGAASSQSSVYYGTGYNDFADGGGGGGAILIATPGTIELDGAIVANGGNGANFPYPYMTCSSGGSGGGIRLVCGTAQGAGTLLVNGGYGNVTAGYASYPPYSGGYGVIRVEAANNLLTNIFTGTAAPPSDTPLLWPTADAPTLKIVSVNNTPMTGVLRNTHLYTAPDLFVEPNATNTYTVTLQATNMPITWAVTVRVLPRREGTEQIIAATMQAGGTQASSTWTASFSCAAQNVADISARASAQ